MNERLNIIIEFAKENPGILYYIFDIIESNDCPSKYGLNNYCDLECMDCWVKSLETAKGDI